MPCCLVVTGKTPGFAGIRKLDANFQLPVLHRSRLGSPHSQTLSLEKMKGAQVTESIPLLTSRWSSGLELTEVPTEDLNEVLGKTASPGQ